MIEYKITGITGSFLRETQIDRDIQSSDTKTTKWIMKCNQFRHAYVWKKIPASQQTKNSGRTSTQKWELYHVYI